MSGRRILLAAFALVLASTLCFLVSRGARRPGGAVPPRAEPRDEAAPAEVLAAPATIVPDAPRREAEPSPQAAGSSAAPPEDSTRTVEFFVTDPAKNPLAGARIRVARGYEEEPAADVTTGADGRARIEFPAERRCFLTVEREGTSTSRTTTSSRSS